MLHVKRRNKTRPRYGEGASDAWFTGLPAQHVTAATVTTTPTAATARTSATLDTALLSARAADTSKDVALDIREVVLLSRYAVHQCCGVLHVLVLHMGNSSRYNM